jgi:predicted nucleic acid-binding protein
MRVAVDTNIVFSAILNSNSLLAEILQYPKSGLHFYSTDLLLIEINEHKEKLKLISGLNETELNKSISTIFSKIRIINANLIPPNVFIEVENLVKDIDIDDTEFVALTSHIHGKLWSGDKTLLNGLKNKGWSKYITTNELFYLISKRKHKD